MTQTEHRELEALIRQLDAEDLEQARQMSGSDKLRAGGDLFDLACLWTIAGIRNQHPQWTEAEIMAELGRRVHGDNDSEVAE